MIYSSRTEEGKLAWERANVTSELGRGGLLWMSTGEATLIRRMYLALLVCTFLFVCGSMVYAYQATSKITHGNLQQQMDSIEQWQVMEDKDLAISSERSKQILQRLDNLEQREKDIEARSRTDEERLVRMDTIITENQFIVRGTVVGVAVLVAAEILKMLGVSLLLRGKISPKWQGPDDAG